MKHLDIKNYLKHGVSIVFVLSFMLSSSFLYAQNFEVNDASITDALRKEYIISDVIPAYGLSITTSDNIVTLNGNVDNLLVKEQAENIALTVKGVKGIINLIDLEDKNISDSELKENVETALLQNPSTESYEVNIDVNDGQVTLSGEVDSWQEKNLAEKVAKGVDGIHTLNNNIIFEYESDRSDYEIKKDVEQTLKWDNRIDNAMIDVMVDDGEVSLKGIVGSAAEKRLARINAWVSGVHDVEAEDLKVDKWFDRESLRDDKYVGMSDGEIEEAVKDALLYDPRVNSFKIDVEAINGKVTLKGNVSNIRAENAATEDARNIVGVWTVQNFIKVTPDFIPPNDELASNVEDALERDPFLEPFEVSVYARNGDVFINGIVDTEFEKTRAREIATDVKGVIDVHNYLRVESEMMDSEFTYSDWYWGPTPPQVTTLTDMELKDEIKQQLWWSPFVEQDQVNVDVDNRRATLTGFVDSIKEKRYASINALEAGAREVNNQLEVIKTMEN